MSEDQREPSDFFSVQRTDAASIPPVEEIVLPPDEQRKQRKRRIAAAVATVLALIVLAWTVRYFVHASAVESAALLAGDTGRPADVAVALETLDDGEAPGLRARLLAARALSLEADLDEAKADLAAVDESDTSSAAERLKAAAYVALAEGRTEDALAMTNAIVTAVGTFGPETSHAKSMSAYAAGNATVAVTQALSAVQATMERSAPRYMAQHGLAIALAARQGALGRASPVDEALGAASGDAPSLVAARARILASALRPEGIDIAQACIDAETSTAFEKAWCRVSLAELLAHTGRLREAVSALESDAPQPLDPHYRYTAADAALAAGNAELARTILQPVTEGPTADLALAGRVRARLALSAGDGTEALRVLANVPGTPAAHLLVAGAQRLQGDASAAIAAAERGAQGPFTAAAKALVAELALSDDAEAAAAAARASLAAAPGHPSFIQGNVAALLAADASDEAMAAAEAAVNAAPEDVRALTAKANVLLAGERWSEALGVLNTAVGIAPSDADLQGKRGDAARFAEQADVARQAYGAALEARPTDARGLVGMFAISLDAGEIEPAMGFLARIDARRDEDRSAIPNTPALALLRVRALVGSGAGYAGVRPVERIKRRRDLRGNAFIRMAIAELLLQAELFPRAVGMFDQARVLDYDRVESYIGRAMAWAMDGRTNKANEAMRSALDAARPADAAEDAPSPAAGHPRLLTVRGRIEANLGRYPSARSYAERALEADPNLAEAHLLLADVAARTRRNPEEHLRAAATLPRPTPRAWWQLARRLGANEEGCGFARRYLSAAPRAEVADDVRDFIDRCD